MPTDAYLHQRLAVPAERLRRTCEPVPPTEEVNAESVIGQAEALASMDIGLGMTDGPYAISHYNVLVTGPRNIGRMAKTVGSVRRHAGGIEASPPDLIVLPNFVDSRRPVLCRLPSGTAAATRQTIADLGQKIVSTLPKIIDYHRTIVLQQTDEKGTKIWKDAAEKIAAWGYMIVNYGDGRILIAPRSLADPGQPMTQEESERLREEDEKLHDEIVGERRARAEEIFLEASKETNLLEREFTFKLNKDVMKLAAAWFDNQLKDLRPTVGENEAFDAYLEGLKFFAVSFACECLTGNGDNGDGDGCGCKKGCGDEDGDDGEAKNEPKAGFIRRLTSLNVQVDNSGVTNPPVICVKSPKWSALFGKTMPRPIGRDTIKFDQTMVECGEFIRAHGGFLILDLDDLLRDGGAATLYKLLHVIRTRRMKVESKAQFFDYQQILDFETRDIDVDVRVIAICERWLARVLRAHLPEFDNLFRVDAEFDDEMPFEEAPAAYSAFVGICRETEGLREFSPEAVARLVEYGARRAGDQRKASAEFGVLKDVIAEADFLARKGDSETVGPEHVRRAIRNRFDRKALWTRKYAEHLDNLILLDHEGEKVGQINALVVFVFGRRDEAAIGAPSRVTGRAYKGGGKILLVQREADTSGPSSNTAVQTISGWLRGTFGAEAEMGLEVQLSFEQCYGGVDGDSASLAEAVVILSALTGLPIRQDMAITGSMNQLGEAQPIGGENLKIEGHFDWLVRKGALKPGCGVALPTRNLDGLMLKEEVIEAQKNGLYQVYALERVEDAIELFLGRPADEVYAIAREKLQAKKSSRLRRFFKKLFRR